MVHCRNVDGNTLDRNILFHSGSSRFWHGLPVTALVSVILLLLVELDQTMSQKAR